MSKRFKAKKKYKLFKIIIILLIVYVTFIKIYGLLINKLLNNKTYNQNLINTILTNYRNKEIDTNILDVINNFNLTSPNYIINHSVNNHLNKSEIVFNELEISKSNDPIIYIYNSHQSESYKSKKYNSYNIKFTVLIASYLMSEHFNKMNLNTIVEENNVTELLRANNWQYKYSYKASRLLLENVALKEPNLDYFIDIHRDAGSYEKTTTIIDNTSYAKIMFVVGLEHDNYQSNLNLATKMNDEIIKLYPSLSRGINKKQGSGVNGIYNQDFHHNVLLIEIGGENNTFEEVYNTINLIAPIMGKVIKEDLNEKK